MLFLFQSAKPLVELILYSTQKFISESKLRWDRESSQLLAGVAAFETIGIDLLCSRVRLLISQRY